MNSISTDMKIQYMLQRFEMVNGIRPNRITMGYHLADELAEQFFYSNIPIRPLEELARERNLGKIYEYEGIPVKVDCNNPNILEVGYMVEWLENKR